MVGASGVVEFWGGADHGSVRLGLGGWLENSAFELFRGQELFDPLTDEGVCCLGGIFSVKTALGKLFDQLADLWCDRDGDLYTFQTVFRASH